MPERKDVAIEELLCKASSNEILRMKIERSKTIDEFCKVAEKAGYSLDGSDIEGWASKGLHGFVMRGSVIKMARPGWGELPVMGFS